MKRFAAFVLAAIMMLSFTACQSEMEKRNEVLPEEEFIRIASDMIQEHYDGILEKNYDKCFGSYAPFYLAAVGQISKRN